MYTNIPLLLVYDVYYVLIAWGILSKYLCETLYRARTKVLSCNLNTKIAW